MLSDLVLRPPHSLPPASSVIKQQHHDLSTPEAKITDQQHHPTAIQSTIMAVKQREPEARILAVFEPRSNSMKMGHHNESLPASLDTADLVYCYTAGLDWHATELFSPLGNKVSLFDDISMMIRTIVNSAIPGDFILIMSNGGFQNIHEKVIELLGSKVN